MYSCSVNMNIRVIMMELLIGVLFFVNCIRPEWPYTEFFVFCCVFFFSNLYFLKWNKWSEITFPAESVKIELNELEALRKCLITSITRVNLTTTLNPELQRLAVADGIVTAEESHTQDLTRKRNVRIAIDQ